MNWDDKEGARSRKALEAGICKASEETWPVGCSADFEYSRFTSVSVAAESASRTEMNGAANAEAAKSDRSPSGSRSGGTAGEGRRFRRKGFQGSFGLTGLWLSTTGAPGPLVLLGVGPGLQGCLSFSFFNQTDALSRCSFGREISAITLHQQKEWIKQFSTDRPVHFHDLFEPTHMAPCVLHVARIDRKSSGFLDKRRRYPYAAFT